MPSKKNRSAASSGTFRDENGQVHIRVPNLGPQGPDVYARVKKGRTTFSTVTPEEKKPAEEEAQKPQKRKSIGDGAVTLVEDFL